MADAAKVIKLLLNVASAAHDAMDDCQVDGPDGPIMDTTSHEQLCKALEKLDGLPEIPGFASTGAAKARALLSQEAKPVAQPVAFMQRFKYGRANFYELDPREVHDNGLPVIPLYAAAPDEAKRGHEGLMRLYSVASVDELIDAMARHIEALQAKP